MVLSLVSVPKVFLSDPVSPFALAFLALSGVDAVFIFFLSASVIALWDHCFIFSAVEKSPRSRTTTKTSLFSFSLECVASKRGAKL